MSQLFEENVVSPLRSAYNKARNWEWRDAVWQGLNLASVIFSALVIWKTMMLVSGSESPVVVVLSGSMEPAMWRGDILILDMPDQFETGDIVVFSIQKKEIPIIHRVIRTHHFDNPTLIDDSNYNVDRRKNLHRSDSSSSSSNGGGIETDIKMLTKGDNNRVDDSHGIYARGQRWLTRGDIMGRAVAYIPQAGFLTIWINEQQAFKFAVIGAMCVYVLFFDDSAS